MLEDFYKQLREWGKSPITPDAYWIPYGGRVTREEWEAYGAVGVIHKVLQNRYSDAEWYPAIREGIKKSSEVYGDVTDMYHLAEAYYEDPKKYPELHKLILSINL